MTVALPTPPRWRQPGLLQRLFHSPAPVLDELRTQFGPIYGFGAGPVRLAVIGDPAALRERALDTLIDGEIEAHRRDPTGDPLDVLEALVVDGTLTDAEIRDQVATLVGAGYDTTAASRAWMLTCCARHADLWARLGSEADEVFGTSTSFDHTTLARLGLADRTMRETLRLHPAGVISPREAAVDVVVGGYTIPKGTLILWSAHLAGREPDAWPDPLDFRPDRFIEATGQQKALADIAWVPFGRGARNCIGFALAQMELTLIVARLAQRPLPRPVPIPVAVAPDRPDGPNAQCLDAASRRFARFAPEQLQASVLDPIDLDRPCFDSIGMTYLLHCLPATSERRQSCSST